MNAKDEALKYFGFFVPFAFSMDESDLFRDP